MISPAATFLKTLLIIFTLRVLGRASASARPALLPCRASFAPAQTIILKILCLYPLNTAVTLFTFHTDSQHYKIRRSIDLPYGCVNIDMVPKAPWEESNTAKYAGINHLAMATRDMDTTIRFWRDLLGMRLVAGLGRPGYRHYFFEISEHDMIAFFEWPNVDKALEKDHCVPVKGPLVFDHVFIHSIYAFDPNNIPIEFSAPVRGVDIRKHPKMKDKKPTAVAQEGPEPQPGSWPEEIKPTPHEERR
jgi:catechol 2,3-dioxygenase-like lactoylglutathione lyase family enzyme